MKKFLKFFAIALVSVVAMGVVACNRGDNTGDVFEVSDSSLNFAPEGETKTVTVTGANWIAAANDSWITLSVAAGVAGDSFDVTLAATTVAMNGSITVTDADSDEQITITVTQSAPGVETIAVSTETLSFDAEGVAEVSTVTVTGADWTVAENEDWITVTPESGADGGTFTVTVTANTVGARGGDIIVSDADSDEQITITVTQSAPDAETIAVSTETLSFDAEGVAEISTVTVTGADWTVTENEDWITVTPESGADGDTFTVTVTANAVGARGGDITVSNNSGTVTMTVTVEQAGNPNVIDFGTFTHGEFSNGEWGSGTDIDPYSLTGRIYNDNYEILMRDLYYAGTMGQIPAGEYVIDDNSMAGELQNGFVNEYDDFGSILIVKENGVETERIPLCAGTVNITISGDIYTMIFDAKDKLPLEQGTPKSIIGKFEGVLNIE